MNKITQVIPYYRNPKMLKEVHIPQWNEYPDDVLEHLTIYIIDDCSPEPALSILESAPARVKERIRAYRIDTDIPWNQHGARNLGASLAAKGWLLMTDIDRVILTHDMQRIMKMDLDGYHHYKPFGIKMGERLESDDKIPVNQFLCTREDYWVIGGYDEDYCGCYGGDGPFLKALAKRSPLRMMEDVRMIRYHTDMENMDATTTDLDRRKGKVSEYQTLQKAKKRAGKTKPENPMRFEWHETRLR